MARAPKTPAATRRERLGIASRVLAATVGGYALASLAASALAAALPLLTAASRADGVVIASLLSFAFYAVAAIWVFSTRSAMRAWLGLVGICLVCGVLVAVLPRTG